MAISRNIRGGKELQALLSSLPVKVERKILRSALRQGANVMRDAARSNVNNVSGDLSRSIKTKVRSRRGQVTATVSAGDEKAFYAHMVEFGTEPHAIESREQSALKLPGHPVGTVNHPGSAGQGFMRRASDEVHPVLNRTIGAIKRGLTKENLESPVRVEVEDT